MIPVCDIPEKNTTIMIGSGGKASFRETPWLDVKKPKEIGRLNFFWHPRQRNGALRKPWRTMLGLVRSI
jgi:hypothetical protein